MRNENHVTFCLCFRWGRFGRYSMDFLPNLLYLPNLPDLKHRQKYFSYHIILLSTPIH